MTVGHDDTLDAEIESPRAASVTLRPEPQRNHPTNLARVDPEATPEQPSAAPAVSPETSPDAADASRDAATDAATADPDLDAIAADLAAVDVALTKLDDGTYFDADPGPSGAP